MEHSSASTLLSLISQFLLSRYHILTVLSVLEQYIKTIVSFRHTNNQTSHSSSPSSLQSWSPAVDCPRDGVSVVPKEMHRRLHEDNQHYCHFQLDDSTIHHYQ